MANLGFQTLVALLEGFTGAVCHRAFADHPDTLEGRRGLDRYDVLAVSISFEGDYPELLKMLGQSNVPLRAAERRQGHPLVLGGGVALSLNPEPLAPFLDIVFLGEAEAGLPSLHRFLLEHRTAPRQDLLRLLAAAALPGVYVPAAYRVLERDGIPVAREPIGDAPNQVRRVWAPTPWDPARTHIWTPNDAFAGAYLLEVSRGCPHGCRFCAAGHMTRPSRFLPAAVLDPLVRFGAREVGAVGLVGAAVSDHPAFVSLGTAVLEAGARLTASSFRVENLTEESLRVLVRGGLQTLTVAVEAGSETLRRRLGKELTDDQVLAGAALAAAEGIANLRLYAMVGLPTETDEDVQALAGLASRIRLVMGKGSVTLSVAPFVPKPQTPFQWEVMAPERTLRERIRALQRACARHPGVRAVAETPKWSRIQGVLSRGGRTVAEALEGATRSGDWRGMLRSPTAGRVLDRLRAADEPFPWDFVCGGTGRKHLLAEWRAAAERAAPRPCRPGTCQVCAACAGTLKIPDASTDG